MLLRVITKPAAQPVSVSELKDYLHLDCDGQDELLMQLIRTATQFCQQHQHRAYMRQTLELSCTAAKIIELPRSEYLVRIISIFVNNQKTDNYKIISDLNSKIEFNSDVSGQLKIQYETGLNDPADVEDDVKLAIMMLACHWFENRTAVTTTDTPREMPLGVKALLAPGEVITL